MPDRYPKISMVTVSYNQEAFIEKSILSVISQGYPNLEYIIIDGASTDRTPEIIRKYESGLAYWVSEKDKGMYDALHRGFQRTTGEIMGWLNSDDLLMPGALFTLAEIFSNNKDIDWLQGNPCVADENGRFVFQRPQRSSKYSFYLKDYTDGVFIQQESTYWKRALWEKAGSRISDEYKYAGDFELWMRFFEHADLCNTTALIGAFRLREGQISSRNYKEYLAECDTIVEAALARLGPDQRVMLDRLRRERRPGIIDRVLLKAGLKKNDLERRITRGRFINFNFDKKGFCPA